MSAPLRVAVLGAAGRMGKLLVEAVDSAEDLILAARVDLRASDPGAAGSAANASAGAHFEFISGGIDVAVEFTRGDGPAQLGPEIVKRGCAWVSGTTGLSEASVAALREASLKVPVLWSPNMSLGVLLLDRLARTAACLLPPGWAMELVETHHAAKLDAPSGTAMALAQTWVNQRGGKIVHGRSGRTGPRPEDEVGIHSVRLPEGVGEHRIFLGGPHESLELAHHAMDRRSFATGAITALRWLAKKPAGYYTLDDWAKDRLGP